MMGLQAAATSLLALGMTLAATYLRSVEFFQIPLLQLMGLPLGLLLALAGMILMGVGALRARSRTGLSPLKLELWACRNCGQTNEGPLSACWSCGLPFQLPKATPDHIPAQTRWQCPRCQVWNGVLRIRCWYCGLEVGHGHRAGRKGGGRKR